MLAAASGLGCATLPVRPPPARDVSALSIAPTPGHRAPSVTFIDSNGQARTLKDFQGQVVLLNFWAPWCPPCVREMPSLQKLHEALGPAGLKIVCVGVSTTQARVHAFGEDRQLTLRLGLDPTGNSARRYSVRAIPLTFLIDRRGIIRGRYLDERTWHDKATVEAIRAVLEEPVPNPAPPLSDAASSPTPGEP